MAYVALYRKFRPQKFEDLVGQEPIVRTLLNQIETGRIAHAYLFTGPRGTGKTSTAKLFARAINCFNFTSGTPCGECDACKAFASDDNMDIIEIDAASNNGVDNIRDIREKVVFAPAVGKYKVYIIDEVHMLSAGAYNALLKTLEEPPKHVVFILATTEIHKLPATILSRCQRFDFRLIPSKTIFERLKYVLQQSQINFADEAIELIAKSAEGGMRDALSLADVCVSYCGNNVSLEDAMNVLGISDRSFLFELTDALVSFDASRALSCARNAIKEGNDIGVLTLELMSHLRDCLLSKCCPQSEELACLPKEIFEKLLTQAKKANEAHLIRAINILSALEAEIKLYSRPYIQFETAIARICLPKADESEYSLEDRIVALEQKIEQLLAGNLATALTSEKETKTEIKQKPVFDVPFDVPPFDLDVPMPDFEAPQEINAPNEHAEKEQSKAVEKETPSAVKTVPAGDVWSALIDLLKERDKSLGVMIRNFASELIDDRFVIYVPQNLAYKEALIKRHEEKLSLYVSEICGKKVKVEAIVGEKPNKNTTDAPNDMLKAAMDLFS